LSNYIFLAKLFKIKLSWLEIRLSWPFDLELYACSELRLSNVTLLLLHDILSIDGSLNRLGVNSTLFDYLACSRLPMFFSY